MSGVRHQQALREFLNSAEAQSPAPTVPYHDEILPASSSTREIAERRDRLARTETYEGTGRSGMIPEGGSIASQTARSAQATSASSVPDREAQRAAQAATIAALNEMGATAKEFQELREQLRHQTLVKQMDSETWTTTLTKLRKFRRGVV